LENQETVTADSAERVDRCTVQAIVLLLPLELTILTVGFEKSIRRNAKLKTGRPVKNGGCLFQVAHACNIMGELA
jgi:hypothetical protein